MTRLREEHRQEVSQRDVRAYTRSTSRSLAGEQNKSAVTDHALPHVIIKHPVRPETKRRTAIRQTVPTKAPFEAETSTIINKRLFFKNFILNYS